MKSISKFVTVAVLAMFLMVSMAGCYGSFNLTKKVYEWNGQLGDRFLVQIGFWVLTWLPVYSIATTLDVVVLNLIEFWTGSNPMAMNNGEEVIRYAQSGDDSFKITMTNDQIKIDALSGNKDSVQLNYDQDAQAWFLHSGVVNTKVATVQGETINLLYPDGRSMSINLAN